MKLNLILVVVSVVCMQTVVVQSANILFYFGLSTYSHRITVWPLVEKLAENGHNVTFLTIYPNKNPNPKVTEIIVKHPEMDIPDFMDFRMKYGWWGVKLFTLLLPKIAVDVCEVVVNDSQVKNLVKTGEFDMVVIDFLYNDCGLGFVHKFKAKLVVFGTSSIPGWWPDAYGFNSESYWIPDSVISFQLPLTFPQRVTSTLMPLFSHYVKRLYMYPIMQKMISENLDIPDLPSLDELDRNASLILINSHFSEEHARSLPPFIIPVGGMHCKDTIKPLPKHISKIIDETGDKGFIYVSFGSGINFSAAAAETQNIFFKAAENAKVKFLWKWDGPRPKNMPENIHTESWMPQQDILAHPKIRAFITHGGLLGAQEAIYHAVPMIALPVFAEQDFNAERLERTGRGIMLEIIDLTQEKLEHAINSLLNDPKYKKVMQITSKRFKDRPMKAVDTALWWTEYVLRHEDTDFMRPVQPANLFWFQRHLLDVWAFLFTILAISTYVFLRILKMLICCCCFKSKTSDKSSNKKSKVKKS